MDERITTEERQARTSSEAALLAQRHPQQLQVVEALERESGKMDQSVTHFKRGDRIRASGFLFELIQDVDAFLIEE